MGEPRTIDLDQIVRDWAWEEFSRNPTSKMSKLLGRERKHPGQFIQLTIDWSNVQFTDKTKWLEHKLKDETFSEEQTTQMGQHSTIATSAPGPSLTKAAVLFQTKFINDTNKSQQYTMSTEKTTRSSCSTTIDNSYTKGVEMSVKLATPGELFEANVGYTREVSLTKSQGQTIDEEVTWGVESQIQVESGHIAEARLEVIERKKSGSFEVHTEVEGRIAVSFTNLKDNNSLVMYTTYSLYKIIKSYLQIQTDLKKNVSFVTVEGERVTIVTKGKCDFRYGIEQEVRVVQTQLNSTRSLKS